MVKKILITGPESTGKSTLVQALAEYFKAQYVSEYAREYLEKLDRPYNENDLLEIAKGQIQLEDANLERDSLLFIDTDLTVMHIWSEEKFGRTSDWVLQEVRSRTYDLYLVPDIDLEWTYDPQRENPNDRERLMKLYQKSFDERGIKYHMINGQGEQRFQNAIEIVERFLNGMNQ
ncbi:MULTISPECIES: AAA family ATPase [unclassified Lentimicrobium]|uniref:AAA family ATPase n=1 Tax=unclassified Lentimicrobium TaxID=2677434 RepID=UPI001555AE18|nr:MULTISPECIES: ATP-binding protein [unclassified Lentimicrobium]NPD44584.1 ATP-binding protein [Lentimicrobium sp. S6]NPD83296.1 ATP-binding protein [Lentimicrobium sp. L6]